MTNAELLEILQSGAPILPDSPVSHKVDELSWNARWATNYLNCVTHKREIVRRILEEIIQQPVDESVLLYPPFYTDIGINLHLGSRIFINQDCRFLDVGGITVGDDCLLGTGATLISVTHDPDPRRRDILLPSPVVIERGVWIGANATVLPGVTIGAHAIIGAGAVVTKDVAPGTVAAGIPAKYIRDV